MIEIKSIQIKMNQPSKTIKRLGLDKGGRVQAFFTSEIRRYADPYVPMDTGMLKNTAITNPTQIIYVQPYAAKQYYSHKSTIGRGRDWINRMWSEKNRAIISAVETYMRNV